MHDYNDRPSNKAVTLWCWCFTVVAKCSFQTATSSRGFGSIILSKKKTPKLKGSQQTTLSSPHLHFWWSFSKTRLLWSSDMHQNWENKRCSFYSFPFIHNDPTVHYVGTFQSILHLLPEQNVRASFGLILLMALVSFDKF